MTKNPFMSAYLSAANRVANTARGHATNEFNADANLMYGSVRLNRLPPDKLARCSEPLLCRRSEVKLGAATLPSLSISPFADNDQLCPTNSSTTALTAKSSDPAEQCSAPGRCRLLSSWVLERRRGLRAGSRFRCRGVRAAHLPSQHQSCFGRGATGLLQTCAGTRLLI